MDAKALPPSAEILGRAQNGSLLLSLAHSGTLRVDQRIVQFWSPYQGYSDTLATLAQAPILTLRVKRRTSDLSFMIARPFTTSDRAILMADGDIAVLRGREGLLRCCRKTDYVAEIQIESIGTGLVSQADRRRVIEELPLLRDVIGDSVWPGTRDVLRNEHPYVSRTSAIWFRLSTSDDSASTTFAVVPRGAAAPSYITLTGADWRVLEADSDTFIALSHDVNGSQHIAYFTLQDR